jgi:hypothetical protein
MIKRYILQLTCKSDLPLQQQNTDVVGEPSGTVLVVLDQLLDRDVYGVGAFLHFSLHA